MKRRNFLTTMGIFGAGAAVGLALKGKFDRAVEYARTHNPASRGRRAAVQVQGKSTEFFVTVNNLPIKYEFVGLSTKEVRARHPEAGYEKRWALYKEGKPFLFITTGDMGRPENKRIFDITTSSGSKFGHIREGKFTSYNPKNRLLTGEIEGILKGINETERHANQK